MNKQDASDDLLSSAEAGYDRALRELRYQEIAAEIRQRPGLAYASIGVSRNGPHLVAYEGEIVGEVQTPSGRPFHDWWAHPVGTGDQQGPFVTARAAAASLIPKPDEKS